MPKIAGTKGEMILRGRGRDERIRDPQAGFEAEFLHVDRSSMADVLGQRQNRKTEFPVKPFKNLIMMGIILPFKNLTLAMALEEVFLRS
jgi:hypothetical protein